MGFIRCSLLFFKGSHGLVVPPRLGTFLLQKKVKPPRLWAEWNYEWWTAKSRNRKTHINLKQIVHSLNLRSPLFRIDWCGNYRLSPRRTFHSSRRSGGILVLFCCRKRTRPPRLWAEWNDKMLGGYHQAQEKLVISWKLGFCLWQILFDTFFLMKKYPKHQERTMLPPHRAKHLARRSFIPPRGYSASLGINFH